MRSRSFPGLGVGMRTHQPAMLPKPAFLLEPTVGERDSMQGQGKATASRLWTREEGRPGSGPCFFLRPRPLPLPPPGAAAGPQRLARERTWEGRVKGPIPRLGCGFRDERKSRAERDSDPASRLSACDSCRLVAPTCQPGCCLPRPSGAHTGLGVHAAGISSNL